ncbi:hypothetical protein ABIB48_000083 [Arthrobacter sp. UYCu511]
MKAPEGAFFHALTSPPCGTPISSTWAPNGPNIGSERLYRRRMGPKGRVTFDFPSTA